MPRVTPKFADYQHAYDNIELERADNGVLTVRFHTGGESLVWSGPSHEESAYCFADIAADRENSVVILTGTGADYCAKIDPGSFALANAHEWDATVFEGRKLLMNLLDIEVPVIAAVNGPAIFHPEIPIISDIVIASETATFQDAPHFVSGIVPGDGAHIVWPHVLGPNRGRVFLLTGQTLDARTAHEYGAVYEVLPPEKLLARARELADAIATQPFMTRRMARLALVHNIKQTMLAGLGYGLVAEALAAVDAWPEGDDGEMSPLAAEDRLELAELGVLYGHRFDAGDGPGWAALFAADGRFIGPDGATVTGTEALLGVPPAALERTPGMRHLPGPLALERRGEEIRGRSYGQAVRVVGSGALELVVAGEYDDVFVRGPDGWQFQERRFTAW